MRTETPVFANLTRQSDLLPEKVLARNHKKNSNEFSAQIDIRTNLLPYPLSLFDRLPTQMQEAFLNSMGSVVRMQSGRDKGFPIPQDYFETNLHHVNEGNKMALEYRKKGIHIRNYVDFGNVQAKFLVHDVGEVNSAISDRPPIDRTARDEMAKRLEPFAARKIIRKVEDQELANELEQHYNEYAQNNPENLEVQMARFIDKAQGTTRVAHILFNAEKVTDESVLNRMRLHLWQTVPRMMEPAFHLMVGLPTKTAREEMRKIIMDELSLLEQYGPKEVARSFMRGVAA